MSLAEINRGSLSFIQMCDVHFTRRSGDVFDLDQEIRAAIENDIRYIATYYPSVISGILVTGDIAYSGKKEEYAIASDWLKRICQIASCSDHSVWVTPGNHDVQRDYIKQCKPLRDLFRRLREIQPHNLDGEIHSSLCDPMYSNAILTGMKDYIDFASKFTCQINYKDWFWESEFKLNDESILKIRGLTSTICSDEHDNNDGHKLVLGSFQALLPLNPQITYLTMCHHPTDWLRDCDEIRHRLDRGAKIQLFGHKHIKQVEHICGSGVDVVRIGAGAVHPERSGLHWMPTYNVISICVEYVKSKRILKIVICPRVWNGERRGFNNYGEPEVEVYRVALPTWEKSLIRPAIEDESGNKIIVHSDRKPEFKEKDAKMLSARELTYHFLSLPLPRIMKIATEFDLLENSDIELKFFELSQKIFIRAKEKRILEQFSQAVEIAYKELSESKEDSNA